MLQALLHQSPVSILLRIISLAQFAYLTISLCRDSCGDITIRYPFGLDNGCGFYAFQGLLTCNGTALSLTTDQKSDLGTIINRFNYPVRSINYDNNTLIMDSGMLTCSGTSLGSNSFALPDEITGSIAPSYNTFFILLDCTTNSSFLAEYCVSTISSHRCQDIFSCPSLSNTILVPGNGSSGNCCFTRYELLKSIKFELNVVGCSRIASVFGFGEEVLYWHYGVELSFTNLDLGCDACKHSGGVCGYDTERMMPVCMCPDAKNYTIACDGSMGKSGAIRIFFPSHLACLLALAVVMLSLFINTMLQTL